MVVTITKVASVAVAMIVTMVVVVLLKVAVVTTKNIIIRYKKRVFFKLKFKFTNFFS